MPGRLLRWLMTVFVASLLFALAFSYTGCGSGSGSSQIEDRADEENGLSYDMEEDVQEDGDTVPAGVGVVHMCGRSVLGGWFEHWGWDYDPENPARLGDYYLVYHEMDVPPDIVYTAREAAGETAAAGDKVMFFKLCFADFEGGDEYSARANLEANEEIVREVAEVAVEEEGLVLILGNALPIVREYSDEWLVWNQREYNAFLEDLAAGYGGRVIVLDLYGTLAAPGGWLRPEYAADPYDSHLNDAAYDALDPVLENILKRLNP
jgi:hypothetical protein